MGQRDVTGTDLLLLESGAFKVRMVGNIHEDFSDVVAGVREVTGKS